MCPQLLVFIIDQIYPPSAVVKKSSVTKKKKGKDLGAKDSDVETDESDLRDDTGKYACYQTIKLTNKQTFFF